MFGKLSTKLTFVLVAAASISAAALAPTAVSAKPFGFGWGFHHHHIRVGLGYVGVADACLVSRPVLTPFGYRMRLVNVCY